MFDRIFMTGVSPVTLDDLGNGVNVEWNISANPQFSMMFGFSETDVYEAIQYYKGAERLPADLDIDAMIDIYIRTDYNKMKKLIRLDKLYGNRKGVLRKITEGGR